MHREILMQSQNLGDNLTLNTQSYSFNSDKRSDRTFEDYGLTTTEPSNLIYTSTELLQLYQHWIGKPEVCFMQLRHGLFNILDTAFFASPSNQEWSPQYSKEMGLYYVRSTHKGLTETYIHREVVRRAKKVVAKFVDHLNGDLFDNRLENVADTTSSLNLLKADRRDLNDTGFKGVQEAFGWFRGRFTYQGKTYYTSWCRTASEAAEARKEKMTVICPEVKELSAQESQRLALLRNVIEKMREGKLKLGFHDVRPLVIGQTAA
jgi:hypothetical protein